MVNYGQNGQLRSKTVNYGQKRLITVKNRGGGKGGGEHLHTVNYIKKLSITVKNGQLQ